MAEVKGLIVEIGADTSKMNKAIRQLQSPLRQLQSELRYLDKALKLDPKNADLLRQKMTLLENAVKQADNNAEQLRAELARLKANHAPEEQIRRLEREIVMADAEAKKLKKDLIAFKAAQSPLGRLGSTLKTVGGKMTTLGNSMRSVSMYAGMATAAVGAFGYMAAKHADDLNTLSKQCGVATDSLQKFSATSKLVDVSTEDMAKAQGKVVKAMREGSDVFDKYGISITNADGSLRSSEDVFYDYMDAMGEITNESERAAAMQELFGTKAYQALMPLAGNVDILREYGTRFEELGLILDQDTLDKLNKINDKIDYMKSVGVLSFYKIGGAIAEALAPALGNMDEKIAAFADWIANLNPKVIQLATLFGGIMIAAAPVLIIIGHMATGLGALATAFSKISPALKLVIGPVGRLAPLLTGLLGPVGIAVVAIGGLIAIMKILGKTDKDVEKAIDQFSKKLGKNITKIAKVAPQIITKLIDAIVKNLPTLINSAIKIVQAILNGLIQNLPLLINAGIKIISALIRGLINNLPQLITAAFKLINAIVKGLINNLPKIISAGLKIIKALVRGVVNNLPTLAAAAPKIVKALAKGVKQFAGTLASAGGTLIKKLAGGVSNAAGKVKSAVTNIAGSIKGWVTGSIGSLLSVGKDLISGLWNGISDKSAWIKSKIKGWVGNVKSWLKKFFKIGSPSKLMADEIGQWIPEGIAVGIEGNMKGLRSAVGNMMDATVPDLSAESSAYYAVDYDKLASVMIRAFENVTIEANSYLDGKKVSNAIAGDMNGAINSLQARQARKFGIVGV